MSHSILHTVNQSPFSNKTLQQCLSTYTDGDGILLLENGAYAALLSQPLANLLEHKTCYVIEADLQARGLLEQELAANIQLIHYEKFVQLSTEYDVVQSWY